MYNNENRNLNKIVLVIVKMLNRLCARRTIYTFENDMYILKHITMLEDRIITKKTLSSVNDKVF